MTLLPDRTTDGNGRVRGIDIREAKVTGCGGFFSQTNLLVSLFPLLEEVFEAFGKKLYINIELKNYDSPLTHYQRWC
jgi:glycerophosphoryl diester phosphodiesterase